MENEYENSIIIDGCVDVADNPISTEEFNDKFLEWLESNNWCFGGVVKTCREKFLGYTPDGYF